MFLILADHRLHELQVGLAVGSGEGSVERHAGYAVFLDRVNFEQVFRDVIEGSDDDHGAGDEIGHGSEPEAKNKCQQQQAA